MEVLAKVVQVKVAVTVCVGDMKYYTRIGKGKTRIEAEKNLSAKLGINNKHTIIIKESLK